MPITKNYLKIQPYKQTTTEVVERLKNLILNNECEILNIDLGKFNFIDACKVIAPISAYHFTKYKNGKLNFFVKDETVKKILQPMLLIMPRNYLQPLHCVLMSMAILFLLSIRRVLMTINTLDVITCYSIKALMKLMDLR